MKTELIGPLDNFHYVDVEVHIKANGGGEQFFKRNISLIIKEERYYFGEWEESLNDDTPFKAVDNVPSEVHDLFAESVPAAIRAIKEFCDGINIPCPDIAVFDAS